MAMYIPQDPRFFLTDTAHGGHAVQHPLSGWGNEARINREIQRLSAMTVIISTTPSVVPLAPLTVEEPVEPESPD